MASMCTDQYSIRLLGGINVYRSVLYQASWWHQCVQISTVSGFLMASMCTDQYCIRLLDGINVYRSVLYQAS